MGVRIFFVISGFLITGILIKELDRSGSINLKKFYYRRTLRIFPPYYFFLAVMGLVGLTGYLNIPLGDWLASVLYVSNFAQISTWELGHTWSLGVEEQFYLLMPAILLIGKRRAVYVLALVILLTPFVRLLTYLSFPDPELRWVSMGFQANADSLATGCMLAFAKSRLDASRVYQQILNSRLFVLVPFIALGLNYFADRPRIFLFLCITTINIATAVSIDWAVRNHDSFVGGVLNAPPLIYIGTLSYSLYLWQQVFLNRNSDTVLTSFPLNIGLATVLALLSFYLIEKPSLRWRQKYERRLF